MSSRRSRYVQGVPEEIIVDDLCVTFVRKRVKNINLRVQSGTGRVFVSAPQYVARAEVVRFVRDRRAWIEKRRKAIASSPASAAEHASWEDLASWRDYLECEAPPLIAKWEPVLGVRARTIAYRNMKSRWGSCNPQTGRICLNIRLALFPPECLEYVVVHELCHLRVSGHGTRFWALVESCLPDWKRCRALLR